MVVDKQDGCIGHLPMNRCEVCIGILVQTLINFMTTLVEVLPYYFTFISFPLYHGINKTVLHQSILTRKEYPHPSN